MTAHRRSISTHSDALKCCTLFHFAAKKSVISCLMFTLLATFVWCTSGSNPQMNVHALAGSCYVVRRLCRPVLTQQDVLINRQQFCLQIWTFRWLFSINASWRHHPQISGCLLQIHTYQEWHSLERMFVKRIIACTLQLKGVTIVTMVMGWSLF